MDKKKQSTTALVKKEGDKPEVAKPETNVAEAIQPDESIPSTKLEEPKPEVAKPLNMAFLNVEIQALRELILEHSRQIGELYEALSRKRKPTSNGKVQVRDKVTGKVYPSKNSVYQSLLKSGELKELVDKGVFGTNPEKNTFGIYALLRAWPDRFEIIEAAQPKETTNGKP